MATTRMGRTTYSGVEVGISVTTGNNDIGTIDANRFFSEIDSPADTSSNIDPDRCHFQLDLCFRGRQIPALDFRIR